MTRQDVSTGQSQEVFDAEAMTQAQFDVLAQQLAQPRDLPDNIAAVLSWDGDQGVYLKSRSDDLPCLEFRLSGTLHLSGNLPKNARQAGDIYVDTGYCLESESVESADGAQVERRLTRTRLAQSANDGRLLAHRRVLLKLHGKEQCFAARINGSQGKRGEGAQFVE
jgi:hypothetical protein